MCAIIHKPKAYRLSIKVRNDLPFNSQYWSKSNFSLKNIAEQLGTEENKKIIPKEYDVDAPKQTLKQIYTNIK